MAHILIIRSQECETLSSKMFRCAIEQLKAESHAYDEVTVPSIAHLPVALNVYAEGYNYEGILVIGAQDISLDFVLNDVNYAEILKSVYEYSTYFAIPIGIALVQKKPKIIAKKVVQYTEKVTIDLLSMMQTIRQNNSLESEKYIHGRKHN